MVTEEDLAILYVELEQVVNRIKEAMLSFLDFVEEEARVSYDRKAGHDSQISR